MKHFYTESERELIKKLARKHNITPAGIRQRLLRNNFDWDNIDYPSREIRYKHFINGVPAIEIAKQNGIKKNTYLQRIKFGWDIKKACTFKEPSIKLIAKKTGLSINQVFRFVYVKKISKEDLYNGNFDYTRKSQG